LSVLFPFDVLKYFSLRRASYLFAICFIKYESSRQTTLCRRHIAFLVSYCPLL